MEYLFNTCSACVGECIRAESPKFVLYMTGAAYLLIAGSVGTFVRNGRAHRWMLSILAYIIFAFSMYTSIQLFTGTIKFVHFGELGAVLFVSCVLLVNRGNVACLFKRRGA